MGKLTSPRRTSGQATIKKIRDAYRRALKNSLFEISTLIKENAESELIENDLVATGDLLRSIDTEFVQVESFGYQINIGALDEAAIYVEGGRLGISDAKEFNVPISEIIRWVNAKGLPEESVFPIARKITRDGFYTGKGDRGKHPFEKAVEKAENQIEEILEKHLRQISPDAPSFEPDINFRS